MMKEVAEIAGFILEEMCVQFTECTLQALYLQYQEENLQGSAGLADQESCHVCCDSAIAWQ